LFSWQINILLLIIIPLRHLQSDSWAWHNIQPTYGQFAYF